MAGLQTKLLLLDHLAQALGRPLELNLEGGTAAYYLTYDGHALLLTLELPPRWAGMNVLWMCSPVAGPAAACRAARGASVPATAPASGPSIPAPDPMKQCPGLTPEEPRRSVSHITRRQCWRERPRLRLRLVHDVTTQPGAQRARAGSSVTFVFAQLRGA